MIDPVALPLLTTNYSRQQLAIFAVCVAGKSAKQTLKKVTELLRIAGPGRPFVRIRRLVNHHALLRALREVRMGQYRRIYNALLLLACLRLPFTVEWLETIPGIGPKTARFIMVYSYPDQNYAILDTHILAWLRENGYPDAPKSTPPKGKPYEKWEKIFLEECNRRGTIPRVLDAEIWKLRSGYESVK